MQDEANAPTLAELQAELAELRTALVASHKRLELLERTHAAPGDGPGPELTVSEPPGRRGFFKLAGAAAAGAVAASVAAAQPAAAANGSPLVLGAINSPTAPGDTTALQNPGSIELSDQLLQVRNYTDDIASPPSARIALWATTSGVDNVTQPRIALYGRASGATLGSSSGTQVGVFGTAGGGPDTPDLGFPVGVLATVGGNGDAIHGIGNPADTGSIGVYGEAAVGVGVFGGSTSGYAVRGTSTSGIGVLATSSSGISVYVDGAGRLFQALRAAGPPAAGTFKKGEQIRDNNGDLYLCTADGAPGTWRKVAALAPGYQDRGGSINLLSTPIRILDTRGLGAPITHGSVPLAVGEAFQVQVTGTTVAGVAVPAGAKAAIGNLTVVSPAGTGYLGLYPANLGTAPNASVINYYAAKNIANGFTCLLSPGGALKVRCDAAATHVILDITGFVI